MRAPSSLRGLRPTAVAAALAALVGALPAAESAADSAACELEAGSRGTVAGVIDGETLVLEDGSEVVLGCT